MKKLFLSLMVSFAMSINAQDCDIHLMTVPVEQGESLPANVADMLITRLGAAITASGVTADKQYGQFFVAGKMNHIYKETLPGPPMQFAVHTTLTLYIGHLTNQQIYATVSFNLRGVGTSEERALINALGQLNGKNQQLIEFVEKGKQKIINYFNGSYTEYLKKSERAAALGRYDEAFYQASLIPSCCNGYDEATALLLSTYLAYIEKNGKILLSKAKGAWIASHDAAGAREAIAYLNQIDPDAPVYADAVKLGEEIGKATKEVWQFEHRKKYTDQIELEKQRIAAAKAIGTAWGNGQKEKNINLMFIK